jgi:hypothetical protein
MARYDDALSLRDARALYFAASGFDEKAYADRWVKLRAGPIPLYVLNTRSRVRAVRLHDLHHVVTGYDTTWIGEGEIAAFEIASGCADHYAAWFLNLCALAIGVCLSPSAMLRAFRRGCHAKNLYRTTFDDALLATTVGTVRHRLALDAAPGAPTAAEFAQFTVWSGASVSTLVLAAALPIVPLWCILRLIG